MWLQMTYGLQRQVNVRQNHRLRLPVLFEIRPASVCHLAISVSELNGNRSAFLMKIAKKMNKLAGVAAVLPVKRPPWMDFKNPEFNFPPGTFDLERAGS